MLRIIESISAGRAKSYYSTADYYTEGQELTGRWRGEGARLLGLSGEIAAKEWESLCDNHDPRSGETLTPRQKENRRVGYDFNFHVPKSVSILHGLTGDERLLDAFRDAVEETMQDIESEMKTRVRKSGRNEDRTTSNAVWGEFVHFTSRPIDGVPDPHLHAHCYVFNTTFDRDESVWKAGQFGDLKRDAPYFEGMFHSRLGRNLAELGLEIERNKTGWEVAGLSRETIEKFSRRTEQIEELARKKGISDPEQKSELGARTRERKQKHLPMDELRREWFSRLSDEERDSLQRVTDRIGSEAVPEDPSAVRDGLDNAAEHCFERKSVIPERALLAEALKRSVGKGSIDAVHQQYHQQDFIIRDRRGRRMVTTLGVLGEEQAMLRFARAGRGTCSRLGAGTHEFSRTWFNDGQRKAVEHV
ncbi:MAG TPA: MobF family relaxase, partial [Planctomicrobium sp.]|nr:MobF family relaxase [Planctomicrobium sp.]